MLGGFLQRWPLRNRLIVKETLESVAPMARTQAARIEVTVLVVDDDPAMCAAIAGLLRRAHMSVHTATDAQQGFQLLEQHHGDASIQVVISDYAMPGLDGAEFLKGVRMRWPRIGRILLTGTLDRAAFARAVNEGQIDRLLLKPVTWNELVAAVRAVAAADPAPAAPDEPMLARLTAREREVLELVVRGQTNAEIASALGCTPITARNHVRHILAKLGVADRTHAVVWAAQHGLIPPTA